MASSEVHTSLRCVFYPVMAVDVLICMKRRSLWWWVNTRFIFPMPRALWVSMGKRTGVGRGAKKVSVGLYILSFYLYLWLRSIFAGAKYVFVLWAQEPLMKYHAFMFKVHCLSYFQATFSNQFLPCLHIFPDLIPTMLKRIRQREK